MPTAALPAKRSKIDSPRRVVVTQAGGPVARRQPANRRLATPGCQNHGPGNLVAGCWLLAAGPWGGARRLLAAEAAQRGQTDDDHFVFDRLGIGHDLRTDRRPANEHL